MNSVDNRFDQSIENNLLHDLEQVTNELCEKALEDAKAQLHPLLQGYELDRLEKRSEFVHAFRQALEWRIARKLALWQPTVEAVFKFDESWLESRTSWDGSLHLLVKVQRLSKAIQSLSARLDRSLLNYFKRSGWSRFKKKHSMLEIQQVTPNELRHGIGYGAMFWAVHSVPVKVWSRSKRVR